MPIVNGSYQFQSLGDQKSAQNQVFGDYTRRDMSDYSQAAYNYLMQQQQQAYELDLWHMKNVYDSPASQMKRYQDAGLNPNLIYSQSNTSGNSPTGAPAQFRSSGTAARHLQQASAIIGQVMNVVKSARDTYDYMKYGSTEHAWQAQLPRLQGEALSYQNLWNSWLLGRSDDSALPPEAPKRTMFEYQLQAQYQNWQRLKLLCSLIPEQVAREKALKELDQYRLQVLRGQNDAVLNIHTGYPVLDTWFRALAYFAMQKI